MKKKLICIVLMVFVALSACSDSKQNSTPTDSVNSGDVTDSDISPGEYSKSERQDYDKDPGTSISGNDVSGGDVSDGDPEADGQAGENAEAASKMGKVSKFNAYDSVMVPTYFEYYDGLWFLVDCYHNQVIYSNSLDKPFWKWSVLDDDLNRPHTIASDGEVYMVDDTEGQKIYAYVKHANDDGTCWFERTQEFREMGERPHYIIYCEEDASFYAWSSMSGQMWVFKRSEDEKMVYLDRSYNIPDLNGVYVRSFMFEGDKAYFVSGTYGNGSIFETTRDTFDVIREIPVAPEIGGMVQITKIQDYYYVTSSTSLYGEPELHFVVRTDSLEHLLMGQFEDVTSQLIEEEYPGTPYNITHVGDEWCLAVHREGYGSPIVHFKVVDNEITDVGTYY